MKLNEDFNLKRGNYTKFNGETTRVIYIDPNKATSENTYPYKDTIKSAYKAWWLKDLGAWGWYVNDNNEEYIMRTYIRPCMQFLKSQAKKGPGKSVDEIIAAIDELTTELQTVNTNTGTTSVTDGPVMEQGEVIRRLNEFKQKLMNTVSSEEFKEMILPIIKFKRAQGHKFSLRNSILIRMQDREATLVKAASVWENIYNRRVKPGSPRIGLFMPQGQTGGNSHTITRNFLSGVGKSSTNDLNPGERDRLRVALKAVDNPTKYPYGTYFYDIRYTEQIPGTEDVVGDIRQGTLNTKDTSEETEETRRFVDGMISVISKSGLRVSYSDELNGERAASVGGEIKIKTNAPKDAETLNSLIREFAHELLHKNYFERRHQAWAGYFIGNQEGIDTVNQQADLTAWLVLGFLGLDMPTALNCAAMWGTDERNASRVYDAIAYVANDIYSNLKDELNAGDDEDFGFSFSDNEEDDVLSESIGNKGKITGREVAELVGQVDVYDKSNQNVKSITESFNKILNRINNPIIY